MVVAAGAHAAGLGTDLITVFFFCGIGYAILVLALTYFRIADLRIKTYTKWVALSIAFLFAYIALQQFLGPGLLGLVIIPALAWIYCTNKTVSTLAIRTRNLPPSQPLRPAADLAAG